MRIRVVWPILIAFGLGLASATGASDYEPLGPAFVIDTGVNSDWVGGNPAVAFDGSNFLAVWKGPSATVRGTRVTPDGVVLDSPPLELGFGIGSSATPAVGFDGSQYLVVWAGSEILARRVNTDGTLPDSAQTQVTVGGNPLDRRVTIDFDGTNYLVAWRTPSCEVYAARVTPSGTIVDGPGGFRLGSGKYPWTTFNGTNHLVVWHTCDNQNVKGNRVTTSGVVLDGTGFAISNAIGRQEHVSVASDGTDFLVVWSDERGGNSTGFSDDSARGTRVSASGTVLDDPEILVGRRHRGPEHVSAEFDGTDYVVVWMPDEIANYRSTDILCRQVSTSGMLGDAGISVATSHGHQWGPRFGCGGDKCLVIWGETNSFRCTGCVLGQILERGSSSSTEGPNPVNEDGHVLFDSCPPPEGVWEEVASPSTEHLYEVRGVSESEAYAVGENHSLYLWNGSDWGELATLPMSRNFGLWTGGADDVVTLGWCWMLGQWDGYQTTESGCHHEFPSGEYGIGMGLWESIPGRFLTVGTEGQSLLWDEGTGMGIATPVSTGVPFDIWDMWRDDTGPIYAVGEQGTILVYNDDVWEAVLDVPTSQSLNAIWGRAPDDIYAVGDFGTVLHYDGFAWTVHQEGMDEHFFGVGGSSSMVYAVGTGGTILSFNGECWQPEDSGIPKALLGVSMGGDTAWAVGIDGTILRKKGPSVFADDFESGDCSAWSNEVP